MASLTHPGVEGLGVCGAGVCGAGVCGAGVCRAGVCGAGMCGPGEQPEDQGDVGGRSQESQQNPLPNSLDAALRDGADVGFLMLGRVPLGPPPVSGPLAC